MNALKPANSPSCPICRKPATIRDRPFCSPRCRKVDLGRWFLGTYRIETNDAPDEEGREEE